MGKGPRAPDPTAIIEAEKDANRLNTYGPYGAQVFGTMNEAGEFVANTGNDAIMVNETPFQKEQRERQQDLARQFGGLADDRLTNMGDLSQPYALPGTPEYQAGIDRSGLSPIQDYSGNVASGFAGLDTSGLPGLRSGVDMSGMTGIRSGVDMSGLQGIPGQGDFGAERTRMEDAMFNRQKRLMDPGFQQSRDRLSQDLANRGMPIGSEASNRALDRMDRSQGQAMADLTDRSVALGGQEQSRLFNQAMGVRGQQFGEQRTQTGLANAARGQQFGEQQTQSALANAARGQQFGEREAAFGAGQAQAGFQNQSAQLANALAMGARGAQTGELMQDRQMSNDARANTIQEDLAARNINLNELSQLLGRAPQQPLPQMSGAAPIDMMGPMYQQYQGDLSNYQSNVGAAGNAAALLGMYGLNKLF